MTMPCILLCNRCCIASAFSHSQRRLPATPRIYLFLREKVGSVPKEICDLKLKDLIVDCLGPAPEVSCKCCTVCCRGLPDMRCVDTATGKDVKQP